MSVSAIDPYAAELLVSSGVFKVSRSDTKGALTVSYSVSGSANAGADYITLSGSVTIPDGASFVGIRVNPLFDELFDEDIEDVIIEILMSAAYQIVEGAKSAAVQIVNFFLPPAGDLDIIDSAGTTVTERRELKPGGWVSVNNDNDNYNFVGGAGTNHIRDLDDPGQVDGENDLIEIKAHGLNPRGRVGTYKLEWTSANIAIFESADRNGGAKASGVEVPAAGKSYWVEGKALSAMAMAEGIKLTFTPAGKAAQVMDDVKFTVYEVKGPMNVPGYSEHTYTIRTPDARVSTISVTAGGTNSTAASDPVTHTTSRKILWGEGAAVGTYKATPITGVPFWASREVNVVKVSFGFAGGDNKFVFDDTNMAQRADMLGVDSSNAAGSPAMIGQIEITAIEGPMVGAGRRGARFIEVGMVQINRDIHKHGDFNDAKPALKRQSTLEGFGGGKFFIDVVNDANKPWYNRGGTSFFTGKANDALFPATLLKMTDSPSIRATDTLHLMADNNGNPLVDAAGNALAKDHVDFFSIVSTFETYNVVRTIEDVNDSKRQYTIRGSADWTFNGSGPVNNATSAWSSQPGITPLDSTTGSFTEVNDGRTVAITIAEGMSANTALRAPPVGVQVWNTLRQ